MRLTVFCGSSLGRLPAYAEIARAFGREMVSRGIGLVYGGAGVGLMGALADTVLAGGGEVVGVIPRSLVAREIAHTRISDLRIVETMHERKALMGELGDGFVALPGGAGTLDELFEAWTWAQLGIHTKPCAILNASGYFDPLLRLVQHAVAEGFVRAEYADSLMADSDPSRLLDRIADHRPLGSKWSVDAVAWVRVEQGRLLAVRTSGKTAFYLPGGKREPGEGDLEAVQREVREELTVRLIPETAFRWGSVHAPAHDYPAGTTVDMVCFTGDFEGTIAPAAEIEEVAWLKAGDAERCAPAVQRVIAELQRRGEL